jgi:hypothetical protein
MSENEISDKFSQKYYVSTVNCEVRSGNILEETHVFSAVL